MGVSFHKNFLVDNVLRKRAEEPDYLRGKLVLISITYLCLSFPISKLKITVPMLQVVVNNKIISICDQSKHKVQVGYHDHHYYNHHLIQFLQNPCKIGPICILFTNKKTETQKSSNISKVTQ